MMTRDFPRKPSEVFDLAKAAMEEKRYDDALAYFLHFWHHALEYGRSYIGVRGSFLHGYIDELTQNHPPAMLAFEQLLEALRLAIVEWPTPNRVDDYMSIVKQWGRVDERTEMIEYLLECEQWDELNTLRISHAEFLAEHKQWRLLLMLYPEPVSWLEEEIAHIDLTITCMEEAEEDAQTSIGFHYATYLPYETSRANGTILILWRAFLALEDERAHDFARLMSSRDYFEPARQRCLEMAQSHGDAQLIDILDKGPDDVGASS